MASLNRMEVIGNLGADPEQRTTQDGKKVVTFNVATSENWTDRQSGEEKQKTTWHPVVIWNQVLGEVATNHLRKGSSVRVVGQTDYNEWTDKGGTKHITAQIVLKEFRGELTLLGPAPNRPNVAPRQAAGSEPAGRS